MIEINSIEDLKPFMKYVPAKYVNGYISYLSFEIVENGEVQDVTINCQLDLTYSFDNIFNNLFNVDEIFANDYMSQGCDIRFIAKDIYIKKKFVCDYVKCDNIYFEDNVSIDFLVSYGDVKGKSISSNDIMCNTLDALHVNCKCVNMLEFKAEYFHSYNTEFSNVTFHQQDFDKELIDSWQGVRRDKYDLAKSYERLPF